MNQNCLKIRIDWGTATLIQKILYSIFTRSLKLGIYFSVCFVTPDLSRNKLNYVKLVNLDVKSLDKFTGVKLI